MDKLQQILALRTPLQAKLLIKSFEKLGPNVLKGLIYPYIDTAGHLTIGWGHLITEAQVYLYFVFEELEKFKIEYQCQSMLDAAHKLYRRDFAAFKALCKPLSQEQATRLFEADVTIKEKQVRDRLAEWGVLLSANFFGALVSFSFNGGAGWLDGTIKTRLIAGDILGALLWMPMFCLATVEKNGKQIPNQPVTGLTLRRYSEVYLALTGKLWRIGEVKATRNAEISRFLGIVQGFCDKNNRPCPLPYSRNLMVNQAA